MIARRNDGKTKSLYLVRIHFIILLTKFGIFGKIAVLPNMRGDTNHRIFERGGWQ